MIKIEGQTKEVFDGVSPKLQQAITSPETLRKIGLIAQNNKLGPIQSERLENETIFVLLGLEFKDDLKNNLQSELELSGEIASEISNDVHSQIFTPVISDLSLMQQEIIDQDDKEELSSAQILNDIENPSAPIITSEPLPKDAKRLGEIGNEIIDDPKLMPTVIANKLRGTVRMPQEEVKVGSPAQIQTTAPAAPKPTYNGPDPYREAAL